MNWANVINTFGELIFIIIILLIMSYVLNKIAFSEQLSKIKLHYQMIMIITTVILALLGLGIGLSVFTHDWTMFSLSIGMVILAVLGFIWAILLETRPIKTLILKLRKFAEEIRCKWNKWQNLKLKKLLGILSIIILVGIIGAVLISDSDYTNMCKKLMGENKEVVSQLNTLDPNSSEWDNLFTQTENENPQLIGCVYPSDSNN